MHNVFTKIKDGITFEVKLSPKSKRNSILGIIKNSEENKIVKISVIAPPEDNKANKALVELLSKELSVSKSEIEIISGQASRNKRLLIKRASSEFEQKLLDWAKKYE